MLRMKSVTDDPAMLAAAVLHDVIEDCEVTANEIEREFGVVVAALVEMLTNPSKGSTAPRRERKIMDINHIAGCPIEVRIIKLADRIDNLHDLKGVKKDFMELLLQESEVLYAVLVGRTHRTLEARLAIAIEEVREKLA